MILIAGGLRMVLRGRASLLWGCVLVFTLANSSAYARGPAQEANAQAAVQAAEQASAAWLKRMDAGQYAECWKTAATAIQSAITEQQWTTAMENVRAPLSKVLTRAQQSATATSHLPGAPDGEYVVILYQTSFEHKQTAQETVAMSREKDQVWRVSGFYIK